jgi:predicted tellurium resistance membrane protein TerC
VLEFLVDPNAWISLATLTVLEIVLGIDNVIFLSIVSGRLPPAQQPLARRLGLGLALFARIALLASLAWVIGLTQPVFQLFGEAVSWRDVVLLAGGLFLLFKATLEIHALLEGEAHGDGAVHANGARRAAAGVFALALVQIVLLDLVFSLDSVLTAIGMAEHIEIMIAAIVIAMAVMLFAAETVSGFVNRHPTVKMLALSFLLLIGVTLVADGLHFHIPRGYLYFAVAFSALVEAMNLLARKRTSARRVQADSPPGAN